MNDLLRRCAASGQSLVVMDLEYTAWEGSLAANWSRPGEYREIVQIGAVRLAPDLAEADSFMRYVRPVKNPLLSAYFIDLTGITQRIVDAQGTDFPDALAMFARFAADAAKVLSNGPDGDIVRENCGWHGIPCPFDPPLLQNIRPHLAAGFARADTDVDSGKLPDLVGSPVPGRAHDALSDARSIAAAIRFLAGTARTGRPRRGS
jgi:inhibitor of KinA sporulation pathway (predicted exonuclease)